MRVLFRESCRKCPEISDENKSYQNDAFNPFKSELIAERANITARDNNTALMVYVVVILSS